MTLTRRVVSTSGWLFGFSVTILLISVWGRAVVADTETLGESLAPLSQTSTVVTLFADWTADQLEHSGVAPDLADPAVDRMMSSPAFTGSMERLVIEVVEAASSPLPQGSTVDMSAMLMPLVPEVTASLTSHGIDATEASIGAIVADLDPVVIRASGAGPVVGPDSPTVSRLGTAALISAMGILLFGWVVVAGSPDRIAAIRGLLIRLALGSLSFAILLKVGSWVLDPNGGRAPVRETVSALAESKWMVPLRIGAVSAAIAASIYTTRRRIRRVATYRSEDESPTSPQEPRLSLSGAGSASGS